VGLYLDSEEIDAKTGDIKERIIVGIFGSFSELNKPILEGLKKYLKQNKYGNVYTADDFPYESPLTQENEARYAVAYLKSMKMVDDCDMIILFLFVPEKDFGINDSAISEIQRSYSEHKRNVIVILEDGYNLHSNIKGIRYLSLKFVGWNWESFTKNKMSNCYEYVKNTCHSLILERFVRR